MNSRDKWAQFLLDITFVTTESDYLISRLKLD